LFLFTKYHIYIYIIFKFYPDKCYSSNEVLKYGELYAGILLIHSYIVLLGNKQN